MEPVLHDLSMPMQDRTVGKLVARWGRECPNQPFIRFEERTITWSDADRITNRMANGLSAMGVTHGTHVATLLDNHPETLLLYLALAKIGAISIPLNTAAKGELLSYYLSHSDATILVMDRQFVEVYLAVQAGSPNVKRVIVFDEDTLANPSLPFGEVMSGADHAPDAQVEFHHTFGLFYTSGTTGPSKAIVSPHAAAVTAGIVRSRYLGYWQEDVLYTCLPLFHTNALYSTCMSVLVTGASVALSRRFSAHAFWDDVKRSGANKFNLLGAMANILWNQAEGPQDRAHSVVQCTMVPVPEFAAEFERRFNLKIVSVYSLTDFSLGTVLGPRHPPAKLRSAGHASTGVLVAIHDDNDLPLPAGQPGEICLRNDESWICGQGYYKMADATLTSIRNLWFHTGDRGYLDEDGYLFFVDRQKDAIRRRGENVSSWEVEQIILRHPAVAEVAAFAVRSDMTEDEVMVSVVAKPGMTVDPGQLVLFCRDNMAYFMVPRFVELVQSLPKTGTQKVEKYKLRTSAEERLADIWDREKVGIRITR